ncbi:low molecular weight phosphotyrosine protein phosphatase [Alcaligenaceae bacterium CGII-47]|nr:low molecular weight phosphotyrosine protein phosphatase [Alcaligenaceae bacterium CGII-47]
MPVDPPLILVMCTGNICRSPMAEALMRHRLAERGIDARVLSRGLGAPVGRAPHPFALSTALHFGVPIADDKRAAQVNPVDLRVASVVLVMDTGHRREVQQRYPAAGGKTFLLRHWVDGQDIPDPVREPEAVFRQQWPLIDEGCSSWIDQLLQARMLSLARP